MDHEEYERIMLGMKELFNLVRNLIANEQELFMDWYEAC